MGRLARLVAVLSAAVLAASGIAAFVRHVPDVQAELVVRKVAFRLHRPSPTFLQGVASPALRVSSYERATLFGDDIALGPPAADERSTAWRSIAASGSVVVTPAVDGSSIAFSDVRVTDLHLEPGARLVVSASDDDYLSLLAADRDARARLSFGEAVSTVECQHCAVDGVETGAVSLIRLGGSGRRAQITGLPSGFGMELRASDIDDAIQVRDVHLFHTAPDGNVSYVLECALRFPSASAANRTCGPEAFVELRPDAGEALRLTFAGISAGRVKLRLSGRARVTLDGKAIAATQLARVPRSALWPSLVLAGVGLTVPAWNRRRRREPGMFLRPAAGRDIGVFISYAREDREVAERLEALLRGRGLSVWRDPHIEPGRRFDVTIEEVLACAKCVMVLWSAASVDSRWVRAEASDAAAREVLCPVRIEPVTPPLEFRLLQTIDLFECGNPIREADANRLVAAVEAFLPPSTHLHVDVPVVAEPRQPSA